jgi:hypothetical protein
MFSLDLHRLAKIERTVERFEPSITGHEFFILTITATDEDGAKFEINLFAYNRAIFDRLIGPACDGNHALTEPCGSLECWHGTMAEQLIELRPAIEQRDHSDVHVRIAGAELIDLDPEAVDLGTLPSIGANVTRREVVRVADPVTGVISEVM